MSDHFVHLHNHTTFSMLDGVGTPAKVLDTAKEQGYKAMAITDHGNLCGAITFYEEAKKRDIKPILGVEAYLTNELSRHVKDETNPIWHITLLAKSSVGYRSLCRMMTVAQNDGLYYKPRIDWALLEKERTDIIALTGCPNSSVYSDVHAMERLKNIFGDDVYFELMPVPHPSDYARQSQLAYQQAAKLKIPPVLTADCHYPSKDDAALQDVMLAINTKSLFDDPKRMRMDPIFWQRSRSQLRSHAQQWLSWMDDGLFNKAADMTLEITDKINIHFDKSIQIQYNSHTCGGTAALQNLKKLIQQGIWKRRMPNTKTYKERIKKEIQLIGNKNFADYFLVVADVVAWAKKKRILVGPARGSSAGSLICYLVGITEIDPIPHGLMFERFIDETRTDLPDIDLDFEDWARDDIIAYLKERYKHVGVLSAWSQWKAKSCLLDVARIFKIPIEEIRKITPLVIQRSGGDARASFTLQDTLQEFEAAKLLLKKYPQLAISVKLEAQIRQKTRHAAGVVISTQPIEHFAAMYPDGCLSLDGDQAKHLGALKLDILGINTLTVIQHALSSILAHYSKKINIYATPLDDDQVFQGFRERKLAGVFQYEGEAMKSINRQIPVKRFFDLAIINAGARPGPLHCGGTTAYINRLKGVEPITYPHESVKEILECTLGIVMFQEQVIKLMTNLGRMSWEETAAARQTMSRRKGVETFHKLFQSFEKGAIATGFSKEGAKNLWNHLCTFGSWAFNLSHAVSYSVLSYWCMWLKIYYPQEFYWASIAYASDDDRKAACIKEFKQQGGKILQVNAQSASLPQIEGKDIRMGWSNIQGIGAKTAQELVSHAPYSSSMDVIAKTNISGSSLRLLEDLNIIKRSQPDLFIHDDTPPSHALLMKHCSWLFDFNLKTYKDASCTDLEKIESYEKNRAFTIVGVLKEINIRDINEVSASRGHFDKKETVLTKWANIMVEDETDTILVTFARRNYPRFSSLIFQDGGIGNIIKVSGTVLPGARKIYGNSLMILGRI